MKFRLKRNTNLVFIISISITLFLNVFSHFVRYITENVVYISLINRICWILLLIVFLFYLAIRKFYLSKNNLLSYFALSVTLLLGWLIGQNFYPEISGYFVSLAVCLIGYFCSTCFRQNQNNDKRMLEIIMTEILIIGLFSVFFAMIVQREQLINVIKGVNSAKSAWNYYSFFSQRNIFAQYCMISIGAALFKYEIYEKKIYLVCVILFLFNIFITDSQTSLYAALFLIALFFYMRFKYKTILIAVGLILFLFTISIFPIDLNVISGHYDFASGLDSMTLRFTMWKSAFMKLSTTHCWLLGMGEGAADIFLRQTYSYGSFHNSFVDIIFNGGIIKLLLVFGMYFNIMIRLFKSKSIPFRSSYISLMTAFLLVYCMETGCAIFADNYFSLTTSIVFIMMPNLILPRFKIISKKNIVI